MIKYIFTLIAGSLLFFTSVSAQISIADARNLGEGAEVTVEGIITNGSELGIIRYIQDETAGVAVYPGTGSVGDFPADVNRGDSVRVRGTLKEFNELLEIDPILDYEVLSSSNPLPDALELNPSEIDETYEGQLIVINDAKFDDGGSVFGVGNYRFSSGGQSSEIYLRTNHPLLGTEIPLASVRLTGIVSQFNSIYQLLPRDGQDIEILDNFYIVTSPEQDDITTSGFKIRWTSNTDGNSILRYGTSPALGEEVVSMDMTSNHEVTLDNLEAGQFYYVQAASNNGNTEVLAPVKLYSTASLSSGEIRVYFNNDVDGSYSTGSYANATTPADVEKVIIDFIDNAQTSIDISIYNTNRRTIVDALSRAHQRGVQVRMVTDNETANLALSNPVPPFSILRGNSEGLMHNKFLIIDGESTDNCWLVTGSMNLTEQNLAMAANNMVAFQDLSICKAYTLEFEEMWGSDTDFPGIFNVKFGPSKTDNTPHRFSIGGIGVESYFSPSDNTTAEIAEELDAADSAINFALLTFTNNTLGTAMLNAFQRNVNVRGIIDNINDTGSEYDFLTANGLNVSQDFTSDQTHHKYCVIDPDNPSQDPVVITGSHNWSASAETRNDENTVIIHDAVISNIFVQEFEARWCEAMGGGSCTTSIAEQDISDSRELHLYPNPSASDLWLTLPEGKGRVVIRIFDLTGRLQGVQVFPGQDNGESIQLKASHLDKGQYIVEVRQGDSRYVSRFNRL